MSPREQVRIWIEQSPINRLIMGLVLVFLVQTAFDFVGWVTGWPA